MTIFFLSAKSATSREDNAITFFRLTFCSHVTTVNPIIYA